MPIRDGANANYREKNYKCRRYNIFKSMAKADKLASNRVNIAKRILRNLIYPSRATYKAITITIYKIEDPTSLSTSGGAAPDRIKMIPSRAHIVHRPSLYGPINRLPSRYRAPSCTDPDRTFDFINYTSTQCQISILQLYCHIKIRSYYNWRETVINTNP